MDSLAPCEALSDWMHSHKQEGLQARLKADSTGGLPCEPTCFQLSHLSVPGPASDLVDRMCST